MEDELGEMRMFNLLTLQDELVGSLLGTQLPTEVTERGLERRCATAASRTPL